MRRTFIAILITFMGVATGLSAQVESSVAVTDDYRALLANPAALAVGNGDGLALSYALPRGASGAELLDGLSVFSGGLGGGYAYRRIAGSNVQDLGISMGPRRNLSLGFAAGITELDTESLSFRAGALYRPLDLLSIGATAGARVDHTAPQPEGTLGIGVRPLAFAEDFEDLLTLDGQVSYSASDGFAAPRVGLRIHVPDGLELAGALNPETGAFNIEGSFSYGNVRSGGGYETSGDTGTRRSDAPFTPAGAANDGAQAEPGPRAQAFLHISPRRFPTPDFLENPYVAEYEPGPSIVERSAGSDLPFIGEISDTTSVTEVVSRIRELRDDPRVSALLFRKLNLQISFANIQELQEALTDFREAGKEVIFYYEGVGNLNYAFAAKVADAIYLHPQGSVGLTGLGSTRPYLAGLLDRLGIGISNIRSHPAKSAYNIFSEGGPSEEERANLEALYDSLYDEFAGMIEAGRGNRLEDGARSAIDAGPYLTADAALEAGLVDELLYEDELETRIRERLDGASVAEASFPEQIRRSWSEEAIHRVALIYATGNVVTGEGQPGVNIGADTVARAIRKARENGRVDAILIRVDSGGGSSLASDIIAREVALTTEGTDSKPVVVSMGATAASGGYYIAAPADRIVAQPSTVTGSIGVVGLTFNIAELSEMVDVNWDAVLRGENADFGAIYRELGPEERERLEESIRHTYDSFVEVVAEGRDMSPEEVDAVARGQVWTGAQALERGLVDRLGGFQEAVRVLQEILPGDREIAFREFTGVEDPLESMLGGGALPLLARQALKAGDSGPQMPDALVRLAELKEQFAAYGSERVLLLAREDLAPHSGSAAGLTR